jgi:hypothetical protein
VVEGHGGEWRGVQGVKRSVAVAVAVCRYAGGPQDRGGEGTGGAARTALRGRPRRRLLSAVCRTACSHAMLPLVLASRTSSPTPAPTQDYRHYKYYGFAGHGAKTSWVRERAVFLSLARLQACACAWELSL